MRHGVAVLVLLPFSGTLGVAGRTASLSTRSSNGSVVIAVLVEVVRLESAKWRTNPMSDLFHESVPVHFILKVWRVMQDTPRHTYQILTKRPERLMEVARDLPLLPNVWLGTSVEDDRVLDRIDALRQVPAAIRFISFEPLIGSVARADLTGIHWVIVGGESGPRARSMDPAWVNEIEAMCRRAGIAFFFKQWGGTSKKRTGRLFKGETVDEMPAATA